MIPKRTASPIHLGRDPSDDGVIDTDQFDFQSGIDIDPPAELKTDPVLDSLRFVRRIDAGDGKHIMLDFQGPADTYAELADEYPDDDAADKSYAMLRIILPEIYTDAALVQGCAVWKSVHLDTGLIRSLLVKAGFLPE